MPTDIDRSFSVDDCSPWMSTCGKGIGEGEEFSYKAKFARTK